RIVAARNGSFSGQVAVRREGGLDGVTAAADALVGEAGRIGLEAVTVRYAAVNPLRTEAGSDYLLAVLPAGTDAGMRESDPRNPLRGRFDALLAAPPAGVQSAAVWITVRVPADAAAGVYRGSLTVTAAGEQPVRVPVELAVADWALPDVADYAGLVHLYQSWATLARYYKTDLWSEAHWRHIGQSLKLMGEAGNIGLMMPLLAESQTGEPESIVVWVRRDDGGYDYDFTAFDRYLDTALRYHAPRRIRFVALNVWGYEVSVRDGKQKDVALVTVRDPATGKKSSMPLPEYGTAECEKLWRPVLTALRDRLAKRGLADRLLLGLGGDGGPTWQQVAMFRRILPEAGWIRESHFDKGSYAYDPANREASVPVRYNSIVWGGAIPDPASKRLYGWQHDPGHLRMSFNRVGTGCLTLLGFPPPWSFRTWMEANLACGRNGCGRAGADYWPLGLGIVGEGRANSAVQGGSRGTLYSHYLRSAVGQIGLANNVPDLIAPGPDGPVASVRYENAREGFQEAEARVFLEKALLDKARPLPPTLAAEAQKLLDERTMYLRMWEADAADLPRIGWQDRTRRLYDLAGKVAGALSKAPQPADRETRHDDARNDRQGRAASQPPADL
ncbi:MAG TPA: glycoside hydrolase domain-containing protein, partial [Phycisphaerae bacterium]|nr:glycoside hydrolase domain-containing protein [Phycisphaerae bacterium]